MPSWPAPQPKPFPQSTTQTCEWTCEKTPRPKQGTCAPATLRAPQAQSASAAGTETLAAWRLPKPILFATTSTCYQKLPCFCVPAGYECLIASVQKQRIKQAGHSSAVSADSSVRQGKR